VAAAVDEEGGRPGDTAQVRAVDVVGDPSGPHALTQVARKAFDVEPQLRVALRAVGQRVALVGEVHLGVELHAPDGQALDPQRVRGAGGGVREGDEAGAQRS
jgi:hypothetical protein